ncbi:hypothetical protein [Alteribacter populi]|uniref:hypothetical protein n=1 Tax=Alteribacter populi TaxID=2011011 RepID=UPI0012FDD211|nr:hypothetical protein [Alteribacter populi]
MTLRTLQFIVMIPVVIFTIFSIFNPSLLESKVGNGLILAGVTAVLIIHKIEQRQTPKS